jgi:hypothetical protein
VLCAISIGCAHARSPDCSTWAIGADARAQCWTAPAASPDARKLTEVNEPAETAPGWLERIAAVLGRDTKPPRVVTKTDEPAAGAAQLLQESRGSGFLEPLAKVIAEGGVALGKAGGCAVLTVLTLGFRSCT